MKISDLTLHNSLPRDKNVDNRGFADRRDWYNRAAGRSERPAFVRTVKLEKQTDSFSVKFATLKFYTQTNDGA